MMNPMTMNIIFPDIPRLYTALAEWLACIPCLLYLRRRFQGPVLYAVSGGFLIVQILLLVLTGGRSGILWILYMGLAVLCMYGHLLTCCEISRLDAAFYVMEAFVLAEFMASAEWQIACFLGYSGISGFAAGEYLTIPYLILLVICYAVVLAVSMRLLKGIRKQEGSLNVTGREVLMAFLIGISVFAVSNMGFVLPAVMFAGFSTPEIFYVRTIVDLAGIAILGAYHTQRVNLRSRYELQYMETLLANQYQQYQQSQETLDLINIKYHDLKHYITALRSGDAQGDKGDCLDRLEAEIKFYEAQNKTGNSVLDTLLTSKSLICSSNRISLTCVADGSILGFMDTLDICSIFGNGLDNAIEYEKKIEDPAKRIIHLSVSAQRMFLTIRIENYYEGDPLPANQIPETSKEDNRFHGFGIRSIRNTVKKYGGQININTADHWFDLYILIPVPEQVFSNGNSA